MTNSLDPNADIEDAPTRKPRLIPALILGFPLGLILLGGGSLVFWYQNRNKPKELDRRTQELGLVMRRDIRQETLQRTLLDFTQVIGERSSNHPRGLDVASSYVDSTLGFMSLGFQTQRISWNQGESQWHHVLASLQGKSLSKNIWVLADYTAPKGKGQDLLEATAPTALINLAGALNGRKFADSATFALLNVARPESYAVDGSPGAREFLRHGALKDYPPRMILWIDRLSGTGRLRVRGGESQGESAQALASLFRREGLEASVEEGNLPEDHPASLIQKSGLPILVLDTVTGEGGSEDSVFDEAGFTVQCEALAKVLKSILGESTS